MMNTISDARDYEVNFIESAAWEVVEYDQGLLSPSSRHDFIICHD